LSGVKLFTEAKKIYAEGNVEKSYIFFMRYLNLISHINKMSLNPKENEYFKEKVTAKDLTKAIEYAETLNHRLQEEFQRRQEESLLKKKLQDLEIANSNSKIKETEEISEPSPIAAEEKLIEDKYISTWELDSLIKKQTHSSIIFDVRPEKDFKESHIKHPNLYSIPEEKLKAGYNNFLLLYF